MQKITPFLWFDSQAEEAAQFYVSIFPNSRINGLKRYGAHAPGPEGSVMSVSFDLQGQEFIALNGGPVFHFTEAISLFVHCENQEELDRYWEALTEGGHIQQCGWLKDRYGLSWQIAPTVLEKILYDPDPVKAERVMKAMLGMKKLDIAALEKAHRGV